MRPLTEQDVRRSLGNASAGEAKRLTLPIDFARLDWAALDFLGWRDRRAPQQAALIVWDARDQPVGVMLRAADSPLPQRVAAMCQLCRTTDSGDRLSFFSARRAGAAGRNGDSVGTYICTDFECSANVRYSGPPSLRRAGQPPVTESIDGLRQRVLGFMDGVLRP